MTDPLKGFKALDEAVAETVAPPLREFSRKLMEATLNDATMRAVQEGEHRIMAGEIAERARNLTPIPTGTRRRQIMDRLHAAQRGEIVVTAIDYDEEW